MSILIFYDLERGGGREGEKERDREREKELPLDPEAEHLEINFMPTVKIHSIFFFLKDMETKLKFCFLLKTC